MHSSEIISKINCEDDCGSASVNMGASGPGALYGIPKSLGEAYRGRGLADSNNDSSEEMEFFVTCLE